MTATVLIADRNAAHRIILRSMTAGVFDRTRMAGTVDELMADLSLDLPDMIVIAADMVASPLADLIARVRLMAPGTPVMVVVADALPAHIAAFDAGADDVMAQPLNQALFHARARRLLRNHAPAVSRATGLAEAAGDFSGVIPVVLLRTHATAGGDLVGSDLQDNIARDLRRVGLSISSPDTAAHAVALYWGVGQPIDRAYSVLDTGGHDGPTRSVICVIPHASPEAEATLLAYGAADVQTGPPASELLRARIDRIRRSKRKRPAAAPMEAMDGRSLSPRGLVSHERS
ncbi:MAG: hypothetical protein ACPGVS_05725 [Primorskyibacter sp.]